MLSHTRAREHYGKIVHAKHMSHILESMIVYTNFWVTWHSQVGRFRLCQINNSFKRCDGEEIRFLYERLKSHSFGQMFLFACLRRKKADNTNNTD